MIERPRLEKQFMPTAFEGCRHWDFPGWAGLKELIGPAAQRIWVSSVTGIVVIAGLESDLWAHCGPALG